MKCGFIGTGTISEAMVVGLMKANFGAEHIYLSPRNADVSVRLAAQFPNITVCRDNQEVVDLADAVILAVRFQIAHEVLSSLTIPEGKTLISVIAATSHEKIAGWTGCDIGQVVRAIPLPFVANLDGVTAIYPPNAMAAKLFSRLGTAVECDSKVEFDLLAVTTSLMGTYYGLQETVVAWLAKNGMHEVKAKSYLGPLFAALSHVETERPEANFRALRQEFSTKGGLNEQVFQDFLHDGGGRALEAALDKVLAKIRS